MPACAASILFLVGTAAAQPLALHEAVEQAIRANLELRQQRIVLQQSELAIEAAQGSFDPSLWSSLDRDLQGGDGASTAVGFGAGLSQPLPSGGSATMAWYGNHERDREATTAEHDNQVYLGLSQPLLSGAGSFSARAEVRAAVRSRDYQALSYRTALEDLVLDVAGAYWSLVASRETLLLANNSLAIAEQQLDDTRERREEGFAALGDVLQVERTVGVARQAVVVAEADAEEDEGALLRLLGISLERRPVLELADRPSLPEMRLDDEHSLEVAREYNASWLQHRITIEGAAEELRLARNGTLPSLDLTSTLGLAGESDQPRDARNLVFTGRQPAWSVGLDLELPIPGRARQLELDQAWLTTLQSRLAMEAAEQDLVLAVEAATRAARRDTSRVNLARQTVRVAEAALAADQELAREGRGSTREVVRSLEALDATQISKLEAEIDLQISALELMRVEGLLLERLGIYLEE